LDFGVPHHRRRIYIVGLRKDCMTEPFTWPPVHSRPIAASILDPVCADEEKDMLGMQLAKARRKVLIKACRIIRMKGGRPRKEDWFVDVMSSPKFANGGRKDALPCLTRARGGTCGFWITSRGRFTTLRELMRFQGFRPTLRRPGSKVSDRQLGMALGNAWSLNVASRVLYRATQSCSIGLATTVDPDFWL
jgi:site-specific DNA-cytosine methylase